MSKKKAHKETTAPDAPKFLDFGSHEEALAALYSIGVVDAHRVASFGSKELTDSTNALLEKFTLLDGTSVVPCTPQAAYQALTVGVFHAVAACKKDNHAAFIFLRTKTNTPSFLFSHHHSLVQSVGKTEADLRVSTYPTPSAVLVYGNKQVFLPKFDNVPVSLASKIVAQILEPENGHFCCKHCGQSFINTCKDAHVRVSEVGCFADGSIVHRECARAHLHSVTE